MLSVISSTNDAPPVCEGPARPRNVGLPGCGSRASLSSCDLQLRVWGYMCQEFEAWAFSDLHCKRSRTHAQFSRKDVKAWPCQKSTRKSMSETAILGHRTRLVKCHTTRLEAPADSCRQSSGVISAWTLASGQFAGAVISREGEAERLVKLLHDQDQHTCIRGISTASAAETQAAH